MSNRLAIAGTSIGRLWTRVWAKRVITVCTELQVYKAIVISSLLSFTSVALARSCACASLRRGNMSGIEALIMKAQLRWVGNMVRTDDTRLPKMVFFSELATVAHNKGRPVKRFKETG